MLIVQKFGGTSVGSIERIQSVAQLLLNTQKPGNQVVAVVSAMAGDTNRLVELATQINPNPWSREYDMLLASGEQVSVALVSLAINSMGGKARPLLAHHLGILTDSIYSKARIQAIQSNVLLKELKQGVIPIVAGFQGIDVENNITTLGRGGGDTSAVAIAAALKADECEIYTDVDGVYTTDPRLCSKAKKIEKICYEEMMELASLGAKVLQIRSVELAAKYKVPLHVRSSFEPAIPGTRIVEGEKMEHVIVSGIAVDNNDAKVTIFNIPDETGLASKIFGPLAKASVIVDVIVQTTSNDKNLSLSFTVPRVELKLALEILEKELRSTYPQMAISSETDIAKLSIVGVGMRHHPGVAAKMFKVLAESGINIRLITTSEIKISVLISQSHAKTAVEKLHSVFELDKTS